MCVIIFYFISYIYIYNIFTAACINFINNFRMVKPNNENKTYGKMQVVERELHLLINASAKKPSDGQS